MVKPGDYVKLKIMHGEAAAELTGAIGQREGIAYRDPDGALRVEGVLVESGDGQPPPEVEIVSVQRAAMP